MKETSFQKVGIFLFFIFTSFCLISFQIVNPKGEFLIELFKLQASKKQNNDIDYSWMVNYLGKILLVFAFMFFIAGVYSYFLVVLPDLISSLGSYWEGSTTHVSS